MVGALYSKTSYVTETKHRHFQTPMGELIDCISKWLCKLQSKQEINQMFYYNYVLEMLERSSTTAIVGFFLRWENPTLRQTLDRSELIEWQDSHFCVILAKRKPYWSFLDFCCPRGKALL